MRVVLSTYDSRGGVEPLLGLALALRDLGAEACVCAPPDEEFADRLAGVGVPLVPTGEPVRSVVSGPPPTEAELRGHVDDVVAAQFETVAAAARGCDALVATGLVWVAAGVRSVAQQLGVRYAYASYHPTFLPSPHHPPPTHPGWPFADNRTLWESDARNVNALFAATLNRHRAASHLPPVNNVRDYAFTDRPWLAADPTLAPWHRPSELDVVQTGAWLAPDERLLPDDLLAFLDAGTPPVYVGFGSMTLRGAGDIGRLAVEAVRARGRRVLVAHGWAGLGPIDDRGDCFAVGEVNQQALFARVAAVVHHGGAGTTTTAALAGAPQVVIPQGADQLYWAGRVTELGIGTWYDGRTATVQTLSAALEVALHSGTRARAAALAGAISTDGAAVAARLLLDEAGGQQPPPSAR
ncbi:glycosyltransferase [Mycobacterium sp. 050134]|uniref:glycosyltransferase n=1 Tax=Mycobacterium sp. 050134 TaxID=3096111 RepID=UPI002ED9E330